MDSQADEIPLGSRIISVRADAFDAMISDRSYRAAMLPVAEALEELGRHAGFQFDPKIVAETFQTLIGELKRGERLELAA